MQEHDMPPFNQILFCILYQSFEVFLMGSLVL